MNLFARISAMVVIMVVLVAFSGPVDAGSSKIMLNITGPQYYAKDGMCGDTSIEITTEDLGDLLYIVEYRVKGETVWESFETGEVNPSITGLPFNTTYEVRVGPRWPGEDVLCPTDLIELTTPVRPAPGACSVSGSATYE